MVIRPDLTRGTRCWETCEWVWILCDLMTRLTSSCPWEAECQVTPSTDRLRREALPHVLLLSAPWQASPFQCLCGKICLLLWVAADRLDVSGAILCWALNFSSRWSNLAACWTSVQWYQQSEQWFTQQVPYFLVTPHFSQGKNSGSFLHLCWGVSRPTAITCTLSCWCIFFLHVLTVVKQNFGKISFFFFFFFLIALLF